MMGEKWDGYGWIIIDFGMRIFNFSPKCGITRYLMGRNFLRMVKDGKWALCFEKLPELQPV